MSNLGRIPSLDAAFVALWSPMRLTLAGLALYLAIYICAPLTYNYSMITEGAVLYGIAVLILFFAGCWLARAVNGPNPPQAELVLTPPDRFINLTAAIGTFGVLARLYDRVFLRGFTVQETYNETRESLQQTVSAFGYIGGVCFVFGMVALVLMFLSSSQRRRPLMFAYVFLLALYPTFESLLQGSRSTMINSAFIFIFLARSTNAMKWLVRSRGILLIGGMLMAIFAQFLFEIRSLQDAPDVVNIADVYKEQGIAVYVVPQDWVTDFLVATGGRGVLASLVKSWSHLSQYLTHSWLVYMSNYNQFDDVIGWGRFHFNVPLRVLGLSTGEDLSYDPALHGMEGGIFSTAISPIYYDFGPLGPLMAGLFGFIATLIHKRAIVFPERWLPLHALLSFACLTMMVDNALLGGVSSLAIWSFIAYIPIHFVISLASGPGVAASQAAIDGLQDDELQAPAVPG